jgi:predicted amidohydrolase
MADYGLVVRNGTLATASDAFRADIGVVEGRIATIGAKLGAGRREINAEGHIVTPGGIDSHCHIEQRSSVGVCRCTRRYAARPKLSTRLGNGKLGESRRRLNHGRLGSASSSDEPACSLMPRGAC